MLPAWTIRRREYLVPYDVQYLSLFDIRESPSQSPAGRGAHRALTLTAGHHPQGNTNKESPLGSPRTQLEETPESAVQRVYSPQYLRHSNGHGA
jgi:hypothetical protein